MSKLALRKLTNRGNKNVTHPPNCSFQGAIIERLVYFDRNMEMKKKDGLRKSGIESRLGSSCNLK